MADANGLVEAMKKAAMDAVEAGKPVNVYFGVVAGTAPLQVRVEQKMTLGEGQLVLSRNVTDYEAEVDVDWETGEEGQAHTHDSPGGGTGPQSGGHTHRITGRKKITVHNGLKAGEEVILIRQQKGQKFIVADRIGRTGGAG